ncbi:LAME_0C05534g1_1 [Lachancea meyersii CBS 8951]|uniref:LAME_0C05534g1_1 n=1 Tax=Lachancea meyersii CBS 8951 TaxID=1266667 RepID=A0A1G4J1V3_9SACH|nr:LAME_0C05534g1_1 [Lachancea meyersii CBS 8951]
MFVTKTSKRFASKSIVDCSILSTNALINGKWKHGEGYTVENPSTLEEVCKVTDCGVKYYHNSIKAAAIAFKDYRHSSAAERSQVLFDIYDLIQEHSMDLARLITLESGKAFVSSLIEVATAANCFQLFAKAASRPSASSALETSPYPRLTLEINQPLGVFFGIISHWSFSAAASKKLAAVIATANTCVLQLAQETPLAALALGYLCTQAGIPDGVCNVLPTTHGQSTGKLLCTDKRIRKVICTSPYNMHQFVLNNRAGLSDVEKVSFTSRGEIPFIISNDADISKAGRDIINCRFRLSNEYGSRRSRIFVHESLYNELASKLVSMVESDSRLGDGFGHSVTYGPLCSESEIHRISQLVEDAKDKAATVLCGGARASSLGPRFFRPTVLGNVNEEMKIVQQDFYEPIASLTKFKSLQEIVERVNKTHIGCAAYLYSSDSKKAFELAADLNFEVLHINTAFNQDSSAKCSISCSSKLKLYTKTEIVIWEP